MGGFAAVLLAGGGGRRLGGVDKALLVQDGVTFLERALAALSAADPVVVVGPERPTSRPVLHARESPAGGGPAAGLLAGIAALPPTPELVGVLAVDMPHVTDATFGRLREAASGRDGAFLHDGSGRRQLAGVLRPTALEAVLGSQAQEMTQEMTQGLALHRLLAPLDLAEVPGLGQEAADVDTWADWEG